MPLPLDALREVQEGLSNNMWMLGLPELAPFRAFILDAAAQCESGAVERALREVRREAKEEREEQQRQSRDERPGVTRLSSPPAADAREIEEMVRARASAVLPQRSPDNPRLSLGGTTLRPRSFSQAQLLAFGPTIHLVRAAVYPDLTRGLKLDAVELFVQIWMVDSQGRCMGGVAQWPTKHVVLHGTWLESGAKAGVLGPGLGPQACPPRLALASPGRPSPLPALTLTRRQGRRQARQCGGGGARAAADVELCAAAARCLVRPAHGAAHRAVRHICI